MDKVIVFHPMQQHSYKTAEALRRNNCLMCYWTSIYYNPNNVIYFLMKKILGRDSVKRMEGRCLDSLTPYVKTSHLMLGLLFTLVGKTKYVKLYYFLQKQLSDRMGKSVANFAIKKQVSAIIAYDTWAYGLIKELKRRKSSIPVIIDYSSLYSEKILDITKRDIELNSVNKKAYEKTFLKFSNKYIRLFKYEKDNADYFLSASSVVDQSLVDYGVSPQKIFRCTYGSYFKQMPMVEKNYERVTFVYIGRMSYAKGVHYLIDAFNHIKRSDYRLLLIGADTDGIITDIQNPNIEYVGLVQHDKIPTYLQESDVVVSASLYDGFSLAILEAVAYNLPILCTTKNGAVDYVTTKTGISFDIQDSQQITDAVIYLLEHKDEIGNMSKNVGQILGKLTWENYYKEVQLAVTSIIGSQN